MEKQTFTLNKNVIIPVTVEGMSDEVKKVLDAYLKGEISLSITMADLEFLRSRRQDLFISALTTRWIGKKRLKLIQSVLGDIQLSLLK